MEKMKSPAIGHWTFIADTLFQFGKPQKVIALLEVCGQDIWGASGISWYPVY